jgi:Calx-beta domain/ZU5 domain
MMGFTDIGRKRLFRTCPRIAGVIEMDGLTRIGWIGFIAFTLIVSGCGGGGGGDSGGGGTSQTGTVVGAAGGTVTGPNGAKVVIPAGALATDTTINIEQIASSTAVLPAGFSVSGQIFAFTPHGTTFAVPVTMTLPFNPALVPAGTTPQFYKTNAQFQWEQIANATFGADTASAQVTSFSDVVIVIPPVIPPLFRGNPVREWTFSDFRGGNMINTELVSSRQEGGVFEEFQIFGGTFPLFDHEILSISGGVIGQDGKANGQVFSSADGVTYGAFAEAPVGNPNLADSPLGGRSLLRQFQAFIKRSDNATLSFTLTGAFVDLHDENSGFTAISSNPKCVYPPGRTGSFDACQDIVRGQVILTVKAYTHATSPTTPGRTFFHTAGTATALGHRGAFSSEATSSMLSRTPLWKLGDFEFIELPGLTGQIMNFIGPRHYVVDLSGIAVGEEFTLNSTVLAEATNRQGDKSRSVREFPSAAAAFLRDPLSIGGTTLAFTGLEPIDNPVLVAPADTPVEPAPCVPGPGPDPEAGVIQFSAANYAIEELSSAVQPIKIIRTGGSRGAVTATFTTSDGTAIAGTNYTPVNVSVFFADGDSEERLAEIPIIQSLPIGESHTVNLALSQPGGCAALGAQRTAVLSIEDTDRPAPPPPPPPAFTIGGTVSGLGGAAVTLVLQLPRTGDSISAGDGRFTFTPLAATGESYAVRVATTPTGIVCTVINGTGTVGNASVTSVGVDCGVP